MQYPVSILINNFRQKLFLFSKEPYTEQYFSSLAWICICLANFPTVLTTTKLQNMLLKIMQNMLIQFSFRPPPPPPPNKVLYSSKNHIQSSKEVFVLLVWICTCPANFFTKTKLCFFSNIFYMQYKFSSTQQGLKVCICVANFCFQFQNNSCFF